MNKFKTSTWVKLQQWIVLVIIITLTQVTHGDDWAEKELRRLEEGCLELPYDALTQRYISILSLYKYTNNPEGHWHNKCYLQLIKLGDERVAKAQAAAERAQEASRRNEEVRRQTEADARRQRQKENEEQARANREAKERSNRNSIIFGVSFVVGIVFVGVCVAAMRGAFKTQTSGYTMTQPYRSNPITPQTAGGTNSYTDENQTTLILPLISRHITPVPPLPRHENDEIDAASLLDQPPSYNEAVNFSGSSAPPLV